MSDSEVRDHRDDPGSDAGPAQPTASFPGEGVMTRMAEACGCGSAMREMVAECCSDRSKQPAVEEPAGATPDAGNDR